MKPKKITSCMLFAMIFSCGMSLQAANIKAVNFIHDNSIRVLRRCLQPTTDHRNVGAYKRNPRRARRRIDKH